MRVKGPRSLKRRGRRRKLKADGARQGADTGARALDCYPLGEQIRPAALWLPLQGKLRVCEGLTSEAPTNAEWVLAKPALPGAQPWRCQVAARVNFLWLSYKCLPKRAGEWKC